MPTGEKLVAGSPEFNEMEKAGTAELAYCGFVLVAGGLGERLGYDGMLPLMGSCFVELQRV